MNLLRTLLMRYATQTARRELWRLQVDHVRLMHDHDELAGDYDFAEWLLGLVIRRYGPDVLDDLVHDHLTAHERSN